MYDDAKIRFFYPIVFQMKLPRKLGVSTSHPSRVTPFVNLLESETLWQHLIPNTVFIACTE